MKKSFAVILALCIAIAVVYGANEYASDRVEANIETSVRTFLDEKNGEYDSLDYDALTNVLVIRGLAFGPDPATLQHVAMARVELRGADVDNIDRIFGASDAARPVDADRFYDLWTELAIEGLSVKDPEASYGVGKISLRGLQMKPLDSDVAGLLLDGLMGEEDWATVALSTRLYRLTVEDFQETVAQAPQLEKVDLVQIEQFDAGAISTIRIGGFQGTSDDGDAVAMRALELKALNLTRDLELAGKNISQGKSVFHHTTFKNLRAEGIELIESSGTQPVRLEELTINELTLGNDIPLSLSFELKAFDLPLDMVGEVSSQSEMAELGYDRILLDLSYQATYDETTRRLAVQNLSAKVADMAEIEFSGILQDVDADDFTTKWDLSMLGSSVKVAEVHLHYVDGSLIERLYEKEARSRGVSKERVQTDIINRLSDQKLIFQLAPNGMATFDALSAFVKDPKTITIHAQPAAPIAVGPLVVGALLAPQLALMTLNITVTAND